MPSAYWQLNDPEWLCAEYLERRRTMADIAAEVGCHVSTVGSALARHGLRRPPVRRLAEVPVDWLREQYVRRSRSIVDIAAELRLSPTSVRRGLVQAGIEIDDGRLPPELEDRDWLAQRNDRLAREVAEELGVSVGAVSRARARHGLPRRRGRDGIPELADRAWLERRYVDEGLTQQQIAEELVCARSAVAQALSRHGIKARPQQAVVYPELQDREWLRRQVDAGKTPAAVAEILGCHRLTVARALSAVRLR